MFSIQITGSISHIVNKMNIMERLENRIMVTPEKYTKVIFLFFFLFLFLLFFSQPKIQYLKMNFLKRS